MTETLTLGSERMGSLWEHHSKYMGSIDRYWRD